MLIISQKSIKIFSLLAFDLLPLSLNFTIEKIINTITINIQKSSENSFTFSNVKLLFNISGLE